MTSGKVGKIQFLASILCLVSQTLAMLGAVSEGREIASSPRIVLVDESALFGGEGDFFSFSLSFHFSLFVILPLPTVVGNVGVNHLYMIYFS